MNSAMLFSISLTGFSVAFFHAAIPTHWLPFVMAGRAQKWTKSKTLTVTALAGAGHVLLTTILGIAIVWLGIEIDRKIGHWFPIIAGGTLVAFGAYYIGKQIRGHGHSHSHSFFGKGHHHSHACHDHHHSVENAYEDRLAPAPLSPRSSYQPDLAALEPMTSPSSLRQGANSNKVAIISLIAMLTFSPCEGFLPVYLSAITYGWIGFALLSAILAIATILGMMAFTWLTLMGFEKMKLSHLEKYEQVLMGSILCILGVIVMMFGH